jgi:hypothetical protein
VKKTILAAALILGTALTAAASDQSNKPSTGPATTGAGLNPNLIQTPFQFLIEADYVFVINGGTKDWTGPLDVTVKCVPVSPTTTCGSNFPGGTYHKHYDKGTFPAGHGQVPASAPSGNSVIITQGGGYDAFKVGLPVGTYRITAMAANNTSPETSMTINAPPPGTAPTIQLNPAATRGVAPK